MLEIAAFTYDRKQSGAYLQRKRLDAKLTQEKLAEKAGCSQRTIADIEGGAVGMSIELMLTLSRILHTTPNEILLGVDSAGTAWLTEVFAGLSPEQKRVATAIITPYLESVAQPRKNK